MKRTNQLAFSVLSSLTVLSIGFTSSALAETITVTRGPNGAAHRVKADHVPFDAQVKADTSATSVGNVVIKGPNGAAHLSSVESSNNIASPYPGKLQVITRGPNGATHIAN